MALEIGPLLATFASLGKTAGDLFTAKGSAEREALFAEFQKGLTQARADTLTQVTENLSLLQRNDELEKNILSFNQWEAERTRYRLVNTGSNGFVYALKQSQSNGDPAHWICAICYESGKKSLLSSRSGQVFAIIGCPVCKADIHTQSRGRPEPHYAPD